VISSHPLGDVVARTPRRSLDEELKKKSADTGCEGEEFFGQCREKYNGELAKGKTKTPRAIHGPGNATWRVGRGAWRGRSRRRDRIAEGGLKAATGFRYGNDGAVPVRCGGRGVLPPLYSK
jgi:hypothetical protein